MLADGSGILFYDAGTLSATDMMILRLDKNRTVQPLLQTPQAELSGTVSPDGRWLAYGANDSGQMQIFVRPFPNVNDSKIQVSTGGGSEPLWARNGQELFYLAPNGALMSVQVLRGARWTAGAPTKLLDGPYFGGAGITGSRTYDVSADGKRFLMIKQSGADEAESAPRIVVVQNWHEELKRLVPIR